MLVRGSGIEGEHDGSEGEHKTGVATASKPVTSSSKKGKGINFFLFFSFISFSILGLFCWNYVFLYLFVFFFFFYFRSFGTLCQKVGEIFGMCGQIFAFFFYIYCVCPFRNFPFLGTHVFCEKDGMIFALIRIGIFVPNPDLLQI